MDISKLKGLLDQATAELNTITDAEFQSRRLTSLRPLTLAAQSITLAIGHIEKAAERVAPKAEAAPATEKKAAKKAS